MSLHFLLKVLLYWTVTSIGAHCDKYGDYMDDDNGMSGPLSGVCMRCICDNVGCVPAWSCSGDTCGMFAITYGYWREAFNVTSMDRVDEYRECTLNAWCSARTVQLFMRRYLPGCVSASGPRPTCETALALHALGPHHCTDELPADRKQRVHKCLDWQVTHWLINTYHPYDRTEAPAVTAV